MHVLPALRVREPRRVRVRELVDEEQLRAALQRGLEVEVAQRPAAVLDLDREQARQRGGPPSSASVSARPCVSTYPTTTSTSSRRCARPRRLQHRVRLADAGRGAEEDLAACPSPRAPPPRGRRRAAPRDSAGRRVLPPHARALLSGRRRGRGSGAARSRGARPGGRARPSVCRATSRRTSSSARFRARATRAHLVLRRRGADVRVEAAAGGGHQVDRYGRGGLRIRGARAPRSRPRPPRPGQGSWARGCSRRGLPRVGDRARRRGAAPEVARIVRSWNAWPSRLDPITRPPWSTRLPFAWWGNAACATAVESSG